MFLATAIFIAATIAADPTPLAGTSPLTLEGDIPMQMVAGIDTYLNRALEESIANRPVLWSRDFSSAEAYSASIEPNRQHLRQIIGVIDQRDPVELNTMGDRGSAGVVETS